MTTITYTERLTAVTCARCGIAFAVPEAWEIKRRKDHGTFYCPAGHSLSYQQKTDEEILREELGEVSEELRKAREARMRAEKRTKRLEDDLLDQVKERARVEKRIHAGVCPYCHRSFVQLQRHIANKHGSDAERTAEIKRSAEKE